MIGDPTGAHHPQLRRADRGSGPGRPRHLRDRSGRHDPDRRDHRRAASAATPTSCCARSRPRSTSPRTRAKSARPSGRKARRRSRPRSTWSARSKPATSEPALRPSGAVGDGPACRLTARSSGVDHPASAVQGVLTMLDANLKTQLKAYLERLTQPIELVASLDDGAKSRELTELLKEIAALSRQGHLRRAPTRTMRKPSLRHRAAPGTRHRRSASPACRWAMNSPRWCWRCCRSAAIRRKVAQDADRADPGARRRLHVRDLFLAVLPELPGRGAGAEPDGVLNPRITPRRDRRRAVPGRGRAAQGHGGADRLPQRRAVRPGPHGAWSRSSPSSTPAPASARPRRSRPRSAFDVLIVGGGPAGAAAAIYAARKGIRTGVAAERFGGQVLDTMGIENFISVPAHRRARSWPRSSKQHVKRLRRRHHEPAARRAS